MLNPPRESPSSLGKVGELAESGIDVNLSPSERGLIALQRLSLPPRVCCGTDRKQQDEASRVGIDNVAILVVL